MFVRGNLLAQNLTGDLRRVRDHSKTAVQDQHNKMIHQYWDTYRFLVIVLVESNDRVETRFVAD